MISTLFRPVQSRFRNPLWDGAMARLPACAAEIQPLMCSRRGDNRCGRRGAARLAILVFGGLWVLARFSGDANAQSCSYPPLCNDRSGACIATLRTHMDQLNEASGRLIRLGLGNLVNTQCLLQDMRETSDKLTRLQGQAQPQPPEPPETPRGRCVELLGVKSGC